MLFVPKEVKRCPYLTKYPCTSSLGSKPGYGKSVSGEQGNEPHTHIYICDTDHKMRAKNTAQLFKVYHFFKFDLVITSKHLCRSKVAFLHKQGENTCTSQCRLFQKPGSLDNFVILGNRQLPPCGALAGHKQWSYRVCFFSSQHPCFHRALGFLHLFVDRQLLPIFH